jgi:hypothetical protein
MTNLEAYVEQMEKTNSSPCYVNTTTLRKLLNVVEAARVASKVINNHYLKEPPHDEGLWFARDKIDTYLKELDEGGRG